MTHQADELCNFIYTAQFSTKLHRLQCQKWIFAFIAEPFQALFPRVHKVPKHRIFNTALVKYLSRSWLLSLRIWLLGIAQHEIGVLVEIIVFIASEFADLGKRLSLSELSHQTERLSQSICPLDFPPGCKVGCEINLEVSTAFRILLLQGLSDLPQFWQNVL